MVAERLEGGEDVEEVWVWLWSWLLLLLLPLLLPLLFWLLMTGLRVRTVRTSEASRMPKWRERFGWRAGSHVEAGTLLSHHSSLALTDDETTSRRPWRHVLADPRWSDRSRNWPEMKGAEVDCPVQRVMSITSRLSLRWLARSRSGVRVRSGFEEVAAVDAPSVYLVEG